MAEITPAKRLLALAEEHVQAYARLMLFTCIPPTRPTPCMLKWLRQFAAPSVLQMRRKQDDPGFARGDDA